MAAKRTRSPYVPLKPATARQNDYIEVVRQLTRDNGRAPSAADVAERMGITRQAALQQLQALESKGLLCDVPKMVSSGQWAVRGE